MTWEMREEDGRRSGGRWEKRIGRGHSATPDQFVSPCRPILDAHCPPRRRVVHLQACLDPNLMLIFHVPTDYNASVSSSTPLPPSTRTIAALAFFFPDCPKSPPRYSLVLAMDSRRKLTLGGCRRLRSVALSGTFSLRKAKDLYGLISTYISAFHSRLTVASILLSCCHSTPAPRSPTAVPPAWDRSLGAL